MERSDINPFTRVVVQPAYGKGLAFVTWDIKPGYERADFFVYRSPDGADQWELLNETPVRGSLFYEDILIVQNRTTIPHYRIVAELDNREYFSPVIGILAGLRRSHYAAARRLMQLEYMNMAQTRDGVEVLLYVPLVKGAPCGAVDPRTGQQFNAGPGEDCYGTPFRGGFARPLRTWIKLLNIGPGVLIDDPQGNSSDDPLICKARCLPFPRIKPGDLIVHPETDTRYSVGKSVQGYYAFARIAIAYEFELNQLQHDDARYRVSLP